MLFTKRLSPDTALARYRDIDITGDTALAIHVFDRAAVMA
jgi:hypothetical protein